MAISVRDLIYFDFDKAASIWSQLSGGLRERVSDTEDKTRDQKAGAKLGIPKIAEANLGAEWTQKTTTLETKVLHHDLLNHLEKQLREIGLVADLMATVDAFESSPENVRSAIAERPYVTAEGWGAIEDYQRILKVLAKFNDLADFISQSNREAVKETEVYKTLEGQIAEIRENIKREKDRNRKAVAKSRLSKLEKDLEKAAGESISRLDEWLIDGIPLWINTFMPKRINLRIYPFTNCPSFQIICNLNRECFVDQDLEHLLYGYGNFPNVPLGVLGLITSIPPQTASTFDPLAEFADESNLTDKTKFESAFRGMFGALDKLEEFMRYSRYPNVTVHPIAVYRHFKTETGS